MFKKYFSFIFFLLIFSLVFAQNEDAITITTYYPSPYGVYHELRVDQMAVGSAYSNPSANPLSDGLIVAGNIQTTGFKMATGAVAGKVLTSDAAGDASWQTPTGGGGALGQTNCSWTTWLSMLTGVSVVDYCSVGKYAAGLQVGGGAQVYSFRLYCCEP